MNGTRISANWRVSNSIISLNSWKNHMCVILSRKYPHFVSNIDVKLARLAIASLSILWNALTFHRFFHQFSYSMTFLGNFLIPWLFLVFQVPWQPWSMDFPLLNSEHIIAIALKHNRSRKFYAIENHILLFNAFLVNFLFINF